MIAHNVKAQERWHRPRALNASSSSATAFARACKQLGVKHIKIKPYTPQTNGKAERFIQTTLREWAYATVFEHSEQRYRLPAWLHRYNWHRPHASLTRPSADLV
jgi:transposase InsO family protein